MPPFRFDPDRHRLHVDEMDHAHCELAELLGTLDMTSAAAIAGGLLELEAHCTAHFDREERLMLSCGSGHLGEHRREHAGILHELERCRQQLAGGRTMFARAWLAHRFPDWLHHHLQSMDSALAAELKALHKPDPSARSAG